MPELFRFYGYSFFFYSREHDPIHVHVEGNGCAARFCWNGEKFELISNKGVKPNDLKRITKVVEDNQDIIIKLWNLYFGKDGL